MRYGLMYAYFHENWEGEYISEIRRIARLGFDVMEMHTNRLLTMDASAVDKLKNVARDNGIDLIYDICLGGKTDISCNDKAIQVAGIQYATGILEKVRDMGGHIVAGINYVGWNCFDSTIDKPRRIANSIKCMREIIKVAEDLDITYSFEVTNRFEQFMLNTAAEAVEYCHLLDSPRAGVQLDINHMMIEEDDIYDAIITAGDLLAHMHVAENNRRVPKGDGFLPWKDMARGLKDIGYDATITLEPLVKLGGTVADGAHMWRQPISDVSDEALERDISKGLAFIKNLMGEVKA